MTLTAVSTGLRAAFGGRRGTARLGVLVAALAVTGGLTIGHGVAAHATKSGYDLAWLPDGKRGQVVQVDPVKGKTNLRLQVASPGADLEIKQSDGQLIIVDHKTGKVTSIDLGTLLAGGSRATAAGADVKVLLAGPRMYLADLDNGSIQAVDPATESNIGTPWSAGDPLVDVGIDGKHRVWALDAHQQLISLDWNATTSTLAPVTRHLLTGTGTGSVIIGHDRGVTVVGAHGTIARVGTGNDTTIRSTQVGGALAAPGSSPQGLVPVADPSHSSVVIIGNSGAVSSPTASLGCDTPGGPIVFDDKVYVPCLGAGLVVVLDSSGHQVGSPIRTGGGDPELTVSGGHLIVSAPGSSVATVIDAVGTTQTIQTVDPKTPVQNPHQPPQNPPDPPKVDPTPTHGNGGHGGGHGGNPLSGGGGYGTGGGNSPGSANDPSSTPTDPADPGTGSATALARQDGTVLVSWDGPAASGGYVITSSSGDTVATVPAGASSATVTTLDPGSTTALTVHAMGRGHKEIWAASTSAITVGGQQLSVTGLAYTAGAVSGGHADLSVSWTAPPGATSVSYTVTATGAAQPVTATATTATIGIACAAPCSGTITVTPQSSLGAGSPTTKTFSVAATATQPVQPTQPTPPVQPTPTPTPTPVQPAPVAMPGAGEQMITTTTKIGNENLGTPAEATLTVTTPADWQSWTDGTCTIIDTDFDTSVKVPCNASGWTYTFDYYDNGINVHTYQVRATATDGRIADSAGANATVRMIVDTGCQNGQRVPSQFAGGPDQRLPSCQNCPPYPCTAIPFQATPATGSPALVADPLAHRSVVRFPTTASHGSSSAVWGWTGLALCLLATAGGAEVLRRRTRSRSSTGST